MTRIGPTTEIDARYGEEGAQPTSWDDAERLLAAAELSWISTVRPDGRPHVTPLITVWRDGRLHFCTGPEERKGRNLEANPQVVLTTGSNALHGGLDLVLEGTAVRVTEDAELRELAAAWLAKYGEEWRFDVAEGAFRQPGSTGPGWVYAVRPTTVYGFGKEPYSQTAWRFGPA